MAEEEKQDLLQLYRFCFLMVADAAKAQEIFYATLRDAAQLAANGEAPRDRLWFFRDARWRCLEVGEQGLQGEDVDLEQDELAEWARSQIEKLEPPQFGFRGRRNRSAPRSRFFIWMNLVTANCYRSPS